MEAFGKGISLALYKMVYARLVCYQFERREPPINQGSMTVIKRGTNKIPTAKSVKNTTIAMI